jgi:hypothetical protein
MFGVAAAAMVCAQAVAVNSGPITITGHVASNTLVSGRFADVAVGVPVTMTFETVRNGFNPFWGPSGHFCNVDEASFEMHIGTGTDERISYSGSTNGQSLLFVNAGFVTTAVSQCVFEFFQMALDTPGYHVYFKAQDLDASVGWTTPLVCGLPPSTPSSAFAFAMSQQDGGSCVSTTPTPSRACWYVDQPVPGPGAPTPLMTITFDGNIVVSHTTCVADFNGNGTVSVQDIFDFLDAWFNGCNGSAACSGRFADVNCSNTVTVQDIFDFLSIWFAGC